MAIETSMSDDAVLELIGNRISRLRLEKNLTQADLARLAGVGLRTVQRLEAGQAGTQLSGFVRICRSLDILDRWNLFLPEPVESPMDQLKRYGKERKRASKSGRISESHSQWTWGEP